MHAALIADTAYLDEELASFRHLVVGLIDEHVRAAQVIPVDLDVDEASVFSDRLYYQPSRWNLITQRRLAKLADPLGNLGVNLVHALTGRLWPGAAAIAQHLDIPALFSAASHQDLDNLDKLLHTVDRQHVGFLAATEPLAHAMRQKLGPDALLATVPLGVHAPRQPVTGRSPEQPLAAVVSGNGRMDEHYLALLEGIAMIVGDYPQTQFFLDGQGADQHQLWRQAEKLDLLANLSLIPRRLGHREIILHADVLLHPQPLGQARSLTLQAMACALPVIAHADPWLDYLIDNQTAWVLDQPTPDSWAQHLDRLSRNPAAGQDLGRRARQWVRNNRLAATGIAATLDLYRRLTGATIPFPTLQRRVR